MDESESALRIEVGNITLGRIRSSGKKCLRKGLKLARSSCFPHPALSKHEERADRSPESNLFRAPER
jgi:hypothetical protein